MIELIKIKATEEKIFEKELDENFNEVKVGEEAFLQFEMIAKEDLQRRKLLLNK